MEEIDLRTVTVRQPDNDYVIIPNKIFVENPFINYSWTKRSRISVNCRVGYREDLQKVEDMVRQIISSNFEQEDQEEVEFFYTEFGDSSIHFAVRFWITSQKPKPKLQAQHTAIKLIKKKFDEAGIIIPFPIHTMDFNKTELKLSTKVNPSQEFKTDNKGQ